MFDDPKERLDWLDDELLGAELMDILYGDGEESGEYEESPEEEEYEEPPRRGRKEKRRRVELDDDDEDRYMLLPKRKGCKGLVFLAVLELIAILAILGWWLQWLV